MKNLPKLSHLNLDGELAAGRLSASTRAVLEAAESRYEELLAIILTSDCNHEREDAYGELRRVTERGITLYSMDTAVAWPPGPFEPNVRVTTLLPYTLDQLRTLPPVTMASWLTAAHPAVMMVVQHMAASEGHKATNGSIPGLLDSAPARAAIASLLLDTTKHHPGNHIAQVKVSFDLGQPTPTALFPADLPQVCLAIAATMWVYSTNGRHGITDMTIGRFEQILAQLMQPNVKCRPDTLAGSASSDGSQAVINMSNFGFSWLRKALDCHPLAA